ncbi:lysophospholipid acyltransferase family protein [Shimia ponticola]|uniref:lysophospholipid acyltransferase family protein n=1 Tax=Shimia ponticola TaxID=2582893 RepID=UPI0011BFAA97|nr:lysophospholipid acyltransferase family protein [Shimia ponticola]
MIRTAISVLYMTQSYIMMAIMAFVFFPYALITPNGASFACRTYARYAMWTARLMIGIRCEVRGKVPEGEVLVAAKHQSFLDIIMIFEALPQAKFIMKQQLLYTPFIGQYAYRLGSVPVNRGRRTEAIKKMLADVKAGRSRPGQLVIYPQGTRVAPGVKAPYKIGTGVLYQELGQPCVPVATNVGVLWPRKGIPRTPGLAIVEFMDPIEPGQPMETFMQEIETRIEAKSNELMKEIGFDA